MALGIEQLAIEFKSKLLRRFPNMREIDLKTDGALLTLKFIGLVVSIEKDMPNALEVLFRKAIEIVEIAHSCIKKKFERDEKIKHEEFRASCARQEKNAAQAALVSSKVDFYSCFSEDCKRLKGAQKLIGIQRKMDSSMYLLNILESKRSACNSELAEDESSSVLLNNNSIIKSYENKINSEINDMKVSTCDSFNISLVESNSDIKDLPISITSNKSVTERDDSAVRNDSISGVKNVLNIPLAYSRQAESTISTTAIQSSVLSNFIERAFEMIFLGLISIRNVDRVIKRAKLRGMPGKKNVKNGAFANAEFLTTNTEEDSYQIGMNTSDTLNPKFSLLNSSLISNDTVDSNIMLSNSLVSDNLDPSFRTAKLNIQIDSVNVNDDAQASAIVQKTNNLKIPWESDGRCTITEPNGIQKIPETSIKSKTYEEVSSNPSKYHTVLNTSTLHDANKSNSEEDQDTGNTYLKPQNKITYPDTAAFKQIILDCKDTRYSYTETVRKFCMHYQICFPEFETVRENDVFICTATFLDISFVSGYEYDKQDAKNGACRKILEYISRNWEIVFNTQKCGFRKT
ncbi:uncharacterized protein VICG_01076 [Vittaforma corneae ATCC 50505]|uniref:Uncharacterized protein n=1 Tax=Vittaforma corneae (strain ATCC 50505) TaxID=993615 RepID=L2GNJ4_VITCO|nr:uncharacterized protein VICG_01076 [Vittaforma corneae ATCC 50505]ELA41892.1 hypothetical protein VICG_01076 [Vittaforma corneae ATCC 50505]